MTSDGGVLSQDRIWEIIADNCFFLLPQVKRILKYKNWPVFVEGDGVYLRDITGKQYLDALSGDQNVNMGYKNQRVVEAIKEQAAKLEYAWAGRCDIAIKLCQRVAQVTPPGLDHVYIGVTGSDAVEVSIALARQYFRMRNEPNHIVISRWGAMHGVTLGAIGATGLAMLKSNRGMPAADLDVGTCHVFPPYCYRCSYGLKYPSCGIMCAKR